MMSSLSDSYALKSVSDLPAPFRSTFTFRYFNSLQSECFSACFLSDDNMVISAPTGSGKTVLFELCILRLLSNFLSQEGRFIHIKGTLKTIYIAPSKALVQEKLRDWNQKLGSWGINCLELTGDNESYNIRNIQEADIILTTPEKFDAVTRYRIRDGGLGFFSDIALVLIDEVHLLNDSRGAALEAIVSRIKMLSRNPEMKSSSLARVRFLAVSATIPNIEDLADWLMAPVQGIKRFGEEMRPVKLTTKVFGYSPAKNDFLFERRLQNYIFDILMQYSRGKYALVFCSTRKGAQEAAQCLSQTAMNFGHSNPFIKNKEQQERLKEVSLSCSDKQMQSFILFGVGYHNGGLSMKDRNLVEGLFLKGDLQILCTTNTLAHGVNLPAHTVVIKSTQYFNKEKGLYMEYDRSMILQMCGRAGRPPFDDTGMVIIMTRRETVHLYENLLNGCEAVESQLLSCLTEHLTAEIVQLTVSDITRAIEWMKCSYLYVRMKKNPENYAVKRGIPTERLDKHMQEICVQKVNELSRYGMIWTDEYGFLLKPLEPGRLMTKYYLKFDTMKNIMQTPENCTLEDGLNVICRSEEIAWIQLRRNEKKLLNDINSDKDGRLRFHILGEKGKRKKRIQTREEKIFVLINDCLTGDPSAHDLSFNQDMNSICSNGCRIAKCMKEYFIYRKNYKGAFSASLLAKCLHQRLWDDSPYLLKQLPGIGMVTAKALHSAGINSFESLGEADPRRIEIVTGRKYPFGNHIKDSLLSLPPKVEMKAEEIECRRQGKSKLVITLTRLSQLVQSIKRHYADMVVASEENNLILFYEKIRVDEFSRYANRKYGTFALYVICCFRGPYSATVLVSNPQQGKLTVKADLVFEEYIGLDIQNKLVINGDTDSNMINACGSKPPYSTYSLPKEIFLVEDDDDTTSQATAKELPNPRKSKREISSMPSFELLEEDLDEASATAVETEENRSIAITGQTVFDHIREKAKNFPLLAPLENMDSSSTGALISTGKPTLENRFQLHNVAELEEAENSNTPIEIVVIPDWDSREAEHSKYGIDEDPAIRHHNSRSLGTPTLLEGTSTETEEIMSGTMSEETIFDHIRRKAKSFPSFATSKNIGSETLMRARKRFRGNQTEVYRASDVSEAIDADDICRDNVIVLDSESREMKEPVFDSDNDANMKHHLFFGSSSGSNGKLELPSDMYSGMRDFWLADQGDSGTSSRKQPKSFDVSSRRCCSPETKGENREVESFLGFKSVFSFL